MQQLWTEASRCWPSQQEPLYQSPGLGRPGESCWSWDIDNRDLCGERGGEREREREREREVLCCVSSLCSMMTSLELEVPGHHCTTCAWV